MTNFKLLGEGNTRYVPLTGDGHYAPMRAFGTGATRSNDKGKPDYEGYISPLVWQRFGSYMLEHQTQADGKPRGSDNWQAGMTRTAYMKSMLRHVLDLRLLHRGYAVTSTTIEATLCAILFNVQGMLHEVLLGRSIED